MRINSLLIRKFLRGIIVALVSLYPQSSFAQQHKLDTTRIYAIPEITISEPYQIRETRAAIPIQVITAKELRSLNVLQVSDAVKHLAGVIVKDYGGIGGLKTISLRSLGAEHTVVSYDGVAISDCQTGQIDIGRFSLDNIDRLTVSNGQTDNIFQPARLFASAGQLNIQTLTPSFKKDKSTNAYVSLKSGSWGLINPSLRIEHKSSEKWLYSFNSEWMSADGKYPYTMHYGNNNDSISQEKRKNTKVENLRIESELFGNLSDKEQLRLKAYYFQSSRDLPGATTLYYDYASQHLWDKNVFIQSKYKKELNNRWALQASAKWNWSYQHYLDPDYKGINGKTENTYYQQEYYASTGILFRGWHNTSLSLSTDGSINTLNANLTNFAKPTRYAWLTALAEKYVTERVTFTASLLATVIEERTQTEDANRKYRKINPDISLSFKVLKEEELRIRMFYKNSFRQPSFNDLYYGEIGNRDLSPEKSAQYNMGVTYSKKINHFVPYLSATIDGYYNKINDKIIATPTKNIFIWSMVNLGKVEIKGVDITTKVVLQPSENIRLNISCNHTYQRALDITNPTNHTYKNQIAYTPRVSGSGQFGIETPLMNLSYSLLWVGKRYTLGQNLPENRLEGYQDHSVSLSKETKIANTLASFNLELLNLANKNYEVVKNFPMPGRSLRATIKIVY